MLPPGIMIAMRSLALAILAASWLTTYRAQACSADSCTPAVLFPAGGNVPADHLRLLYVPASSAPLGDDAGLAMPIMYRIEGTTKVSVPYTTSSDSEGVWLAPTTEQPLGTQLIVQAPANSCDSETLLRETYSITEARPTLPTVLGTLNATSKRALIPIADDACSQVADVSYAELSIELSDEARPFASLWRYQLYVDGALHPSFASGPERLPHGTDRVYARCATIDAGAKGGVAPGVHAVHFAAQIDDEPPLLTPDVQVELSCAGPAPISADDEHPSGTTDDTCSLSSRQPGWLGLLMLVLIARRRRVQA